MGGNDAASEALGALRSGLACAFAESLAEVPGGGAQSGENAESDGDSGGDKQREKQNWKVD